MPIAGLRPVAVIGRGRVKTICEKCKWEMHAKFRLESVKKWGIECKFRIVFKRMWKIFIASANTASFHTASAEDCLLWGFLQRRLWRKQSLKLDEPAAIYDPKLTPVVIVLGWYPSKFSEHMLEALLIDCCSG
jgi:hypothetical protein